MQLLNLHPNLEGRVQGFSFEGQNQQLWATYSMPAFPRARASCSRPFGPTSWAPVEAVAQSTESTATCVKLSTSLRPLLRCNAPQNARIPNGAIFGNSNIEC